ncbi:MAG: ATP-binding protein [Candidatus Nanohaloarchaea archaeon]
MTFREKDCEPDIDPDGFFDALSNQPMDFQDALAELIDNSISASIEGPDYFEEDQPEDIAPENPDQNFRIQITIIRDGDTVEVIVADSGEGMTFDLIDEHLLSSGDTSQSTGILNEHGFGLKNALSVLTGNNTDSGFKIISRVEENPDKVTILDGPFPEATLKEKEYEESRELWNEGTETIADPRFGTRIRFETDWSLFQSAYPRAGSLDKICYGLREHLGVMYRHFLKTESNQIVLNWSEKGTEEKGSKEVKPIFPEFREGEEELEDGTKRDYYEVDKLKVRDEDGQPHTVIYRRGIVDWDKTRESYNHSNLAINSEKGKSPFRIYYRKNQTTQGLDIVYLGRTINTSLMEEIWDQIPTDGEGFDSITTHNSYNSFVGELIILSEDFETVNNKIGINPNSELWNDLKQKLNEKEEFHPRKRGDEEVERDKKKRLKTHLQDDETTSNVTEESGDTKWGVSPDLVRELESGNEYLYELKRGKAKPKTSTSA